MNFLNEFTTSISYQRNILCFDVTLRYIAKRKNALHISKYSTYTIYDLNLCIPCGSRTWKAVPDATGTRTYLSTDRAIEL
jgi:hypothetical protein